MTFRSLLVGAICLGGVAMAPNPAAADWNFYGGNPEHQLYTTDRVRAPLGILWKHTTNTWSKAPGNVGGPVIQEGTVYFPSKNQIYAVDVNSGELKWRAPEGDANDPNIPRISATPVINGELLYVPQSDGSLTVYNALDGKAANSLRTGGEIQCSPTMVGDNLYFGSDDDFLYCVDGRSLEVRWKSTMDGRRPMKLTDDVTSSPCVYNGVVYVTTGDLKIWAFNQDNGRFLWQQRIAASNPSVAPVAFNGRIFMASGTNMYLFRLRTAVNYRTYQLAANVESDITTTPIITETAWYFGDRAGYFYGFDPAGKILQTPDQKPFKIKLEGRPFATPILTADTLYVATDRGFLYGIDPVTAAVRWSQRSEAPKGIEPLLSFYPHRAPLAVYDRKLFVLGDDGTLSCLSEDGADDEGPVITRPRPTKGTRMSGFAPLYFSAYLWDEGTGINPDTIEFALDDQPIDQDPIPYTERPAVPRKGWYYDPIKRTIRYQTIKAETGQVDKPLAEGRHKVSVTAADWRGNPTTYEWTFIVDPKIPRGAEAVRPTAGTRKGATAGQQGAAAGAQGGPMAGPGGVAGGPGSGFGAGNGRQLFRGRNSYQYTNRGQNGYNFGRGQGGGFGSQGGGGFGGQGGGFGGQGGGFGGRGGGGGGFGGRGGGGGFGGQGGGFGSRGGGRGGGGGY